jgi:Zn-dependent protease/CBS domain-containing protein
MNWSVQIGRILGIPIRLHISFLVILVLFIYLFAGYEDEIFYKTTGIVLGFGGMNISFAMKLLFSTITSLFFFSTILIHELSHSYVARNNGLKIESITLFVFGGVAQMENIPHDPKLELKMAAAGPGLSLFIGLLSHTIYDLFGPVVLEDAGMITKNVILITLGIIAYFNIAIALFNMLPAFPMDGGRIFRALLAFWLPYLEATRTAVAIGKTFALFMGLFSIMTWNFILIFIAFFIYIGAQNEEKDIFFSVSLEGITVADVMTSVPDVIYIPPDWTLSQLVDVMFRFKHMGYPVQEELDRAPQGVITFHDVQKVPKKQHDEVKVKDVMSKKIISVNPQINAYNALHILAKNRISRLLVISNNRIKGIITMKDILRKMEFMNISLDD